MLPGPWLATGEPRIRSKIRINCKDKAKSVLDDEDSSVTRSDAEFRRLFGLAGLKVTHTEMQTDFPPGMFAIRMYWLAPADA